MYTLCKDMNEGANEDVCDGMHKGMHNDGNIAFLSSHTSMARKYSYWFNKIYIQSKLFTVGFGKYLGNFGMFCQASCPLDM